MGSKSNTATLLSSSQSRNNYHFRTGGGNTTRYIVGSIGRACRLHVRKDSQHQQTSNRSNSSASGQQRNQNVAIATQVINPSAIGGSLKNRRFVEHFGPRDDDQVSFLSRRRRTVFGKACCYITAIAVTLMMVTGLILAVGYLQSEKQRISTRPIKLAQGQSFDNLMMVTTTTRRPPILPTPAIHPPVLKHPLGSAEEEEDDMDEIGVEDYFDDLGLQSLEKDVSPNKVSIDLAEVSSPNANSPEEDDRKINLADSSENELHDVGSLNNEKVKADSNIGNSDNDVAVSSIVEDEQERFTEVKVLPPPNFNGFNGLSFEFPIYRAKGSSKSDHQSEHSSSSNDENHANSTKSSTQEQTNEQETKDESGKNSQNPSNFTSLLDSGETEYEHEEEALSSDDEEKSYANAHESPHNNLQKNKKHLSFKNETATKTIPQRNENSGNANDTETDTAPSTPPSNNGNHNNHDVETASSVKLQTDLFDNNEEIADFETSASEEFLENERFPSNRNRKPEHHNEIRVPPPHPINRINKHDSHSSRSQSNRNGRNRINNSNRNSDDSDSNKPSSNIEIIDSLGDDDELERVPQPPPPPARNDPRKLSLRPPSHYDRNKSKLNRPQISPSKDLDKVLLLDDPPKEAPPSTTTAAPPQADSVPILDYKVDFTKFLSSTTTATPPTNSEGFDLQKFIAQLPTLSPTSASNPYPDFKFEVKSPASSSNNGGSFDNLLGPNNVNSNQNFNLQIPSATTDFNLNLAQLQPYSSSQILSNTIPGTSGGSSGDGGGSSSSIDTYSSQGNQFSKRTFNNFDLSASGSSLSNKANTNSNPFAHLLGSQAPTTGVFGSVSSTGATLNLFQPQQSFNFDTSASNPQGILNIPSGTVPVDLSASHISVNGPSKPYSGFSFSPSSSSDLPYPNLDTTGSYNQPSTFSFNSYDSSNNGNFGYGSGDNNIPILTTGNGQIPNYNTITQGINLLKLLAPQRPNNNQNGGFSFDDQQSSGSSSLSSYYTPQVDFSKSDYQIPSYPGSGGTNGGGGGGHAFLDFWKWKNSQDLSTSPSETFTKTVPPPAAQPSSGGFDPRSSFRSFDASEDQTSSGSSFSKAIVSKAAQDLKNTKLISSKISSTTTEASLLKSLTSKKSDDHSSQPRSISISILPKPVSSFVDALTKRPATFKRNKKPSPKGPSSPTPTTTDPESLIPKPRKRDFSSPTLPETPPESSTTKRYPEVRLKSGFFT